MSRRQKMLKIANRSRKVDKEPFLEMFFPLAGNAEPVDGENNSCACE